MAVVVALAAVAFYFVPSVREAVLPTQTAQNAEPQAPEQTGPVKENIGDPKMSGLWQSQTDLKFTREIRPDGVMIDRYKGDTSAGAGGEWSTSDAAGAAVAGIKLAANLSGLPIIKVVWEGGVETTFFAVNKLDDNSMTTTDLSGKGSVTIYKKITQVP